MPKKCTRRTVVLSLAALLAILAGCGPAAPSSEAGASSPLPVMSVPEVRPSAEPTGFAGTFYVAAMVDLGVLEARSYVRNAVKTHAEAGVNCLLWWAEKSLYVEEFLEECAKYGISAILMDNDGVTGAGGQYAPITQADFSEAVAPYLDNPQVLGFSNWDEPLHEEPYYEMMKQRQDWMHEADPDSLSFINLLPSYGPYTWGNGLWKEMADTLIDQVDPDVLAVDYYEYAVSGPTPDWDRSFLWRDLGYLRKRAMETDKPLWFYFQGSDYDGKAGEMTAGRLRLQMNAGLAYGCRWLCYWTSSGAITDREGRPTARFDEVRTINAQVTAAGRYLLGMRPGELHHAGLSPKPDSNQTLGDLYFCSRLDDSAVFTALPDAPLILSTFTDAAGRTVVAAVNRQDREPLQTAVPLKTARRVSRPDLEAGGEILLGKALDALPVDLLPGGLALYILE